MSQEDLLRALVALDPSTSSDAALEAVASLLGGRRAHLEGLLVEDVNLLHLSELPFVRVFDRTTGSERSLDRNRLERQLRSRAERLRKAFEETAKRLQMSGSFHVERGEVRSELSRAARGADLVVISHTRSRRREAPLPATFRGLAWAETRTLVVVREAWKTGRTVTVLAEDVERDRVALRLAADLARSEGLSLTVLVNETPDNAWEAELDRLNREPGLTIRRQPLPAGPVANLIDSAKKSRPLALVLAAEHPSLDEKTLARLLDELPCALVLAR